MDFVIVQCSDCGATIEMQVGQFPQLPDGWMITASEKVEGGVHLFAHCPQHLPRRLASGNILIHEAVENLEVCEYALTEREVRLAFGYDRS